MTTRNFEYLFRPKSLAVFGASDRPGSVGATVIRNVLAGGFIGPIYAVNPRHREVAGQRTFPDVPSLPETPDLASSRRHRRQCRASSVHSARAALAPQSF